jgi:hypothetical protein
MNEKNEEIGPERITFATFLLRILAGTTGGIVGGVVLLLIFIMASSVFEPIASFNEQVKHISPIFTFVIIIMVFLASTISNIGSTWLMGLVEKEKYTKISSAIYQVFIVSLIIFILMAPVYFITGAANPSITAYVIALHIILSAQASALIFELISNYKYSVVGVYGVTFSVLFSAGLLFSLASVLGNPQLLLFVALPIVWGSVAFVGSIVNGLYGWIARTYDKDFLSSEEMFGDDYGEEVVEDEEPRAEDKDGGDFLRNN